MSVRQSSRRTAPQPAKGPSLTDRLQEQREQITKATGVLDCCRYASEQIDTDRGLPDLERALGAAHDVLDHVLAGLAEIATEFDRAQKPR